MSESTASEGAPPASTELPEQRTTQFGWVRYPPGGTLGPRTQTGLQMVVIESGEARIAVGRRRRVLAAGEVCILGPGRREHFQFARDRETVHTWCTLFFDLPHEQVQPYMRELPFTLAATPLLRKLIGLGLEARSTPGDTGRALVNALGWATYHAYVAAARPGTAPAAPPYPPAVERARQFIAHHLNEPIKVTDIARAASVSANHLTRLFKLHLGTTPNRYLWQTRTQQGVDLLEHTGLSVAEIAYRVGFSTPFHFSRLTRQLHGAPPKALRQRFWGQKRDEEKRA